MTFAEKSNEGALNGSTAVDIVAVPGSGVTRVVRQINVFNRDTAAVTLTLIYDNGTARTIDKQTLQPDESYIYDGVLVLDATTKKVTAKLAGAPATTQPDFVASYAEIA